MDIISIIIIAIALVFLITGLRFHRKSAAHEEEAKAKRKEYKLPQGRITYNDLGGEGKILYSTRHNISGKMDFKVEENGLKVPVETKTTIAAIPYKNHILKLAAYFLLMEENTGTRPPHGYLRYEDETNVVEHKIENTEELRTELLATINEIRSCIRSRSATRNHNSPAKCRGCSAKNICEQRLSV